MFELAVRPNFHRFPGRFHSDHITVVEFCGEKFNVNTEKLFYCTTLDKCLPKFTSPSNITQLQIKNDLEIKDMKHLSLVFDYINGSQIKLTYQNYQDIYQIALNLGVVPLIEELTPYIILKQQMKPIKTLTLLDNGLNSTIITLLAILFPLVKSLAVITSLCFEDTKKIITSPKLFPISDETKILSLLYFMEDKTSEFLSFIEQEKYTISKEVFHIVEEKAKMLDKRNEIAILLSINKNDDDTEEYSKIEEREILQCWDNYKRNLSKMPVYMTPDDDNEERETKVIMSSASSMDSLNTITDDSDDSADTHFSTEFMDPKTNPFIRMIKTNFMNVE